MKCETCLSVLVARPAGRSSLLFRIQRTEKTGITTSWELKTASYAKNLYRCATTGEANALEMNNPLRSLRLSASGHFVTGAVFTQIAPILVLDRTLVCSGTIPSCSLCRCSILSSRYICTPGPALPTPVIPEDCVLEYNQSAGCFTRDYVPACSISAPVKLIILEYPGPPTKRYTTKDICANQQVI
ncbi:hypothetical protein BDW68DRAFT_26556 [Aspergillus falconensis]